MGEILGNVTTPKIHSMYAKARENEGRYKEACAAYLKAGEWENAIRFVETKIRHHLLIVHDRIDLEFN